MDVQYLRAIHHSFDIRDRKDATIEEAQERLRRELVSSVNYRAEAKRNGVSQPMCLVPTQVRYKCTFICMPGDEIHSGDEIEAFGEHWIVIETNSSNPVQTSGMAWLCNHLFRFQNWTSEIIERWGVLDSGVYSTTLNGNSSVRETDKQFKIYLPYDDDTSKIYVDKRFAVDTRFDSTGKEILECYQITGSNRVARSYGKGAHLLVLDARSDNASHDKDNMELLICDYIPPDSESVSTVGFDIRGRNTISISSSRAFTIVTTDGRGLSDDMVFRWSITPSLEAIAFSESGTSVRVIVPDDTSLIGEVLSISVSNKDGQTLATKKVEVTS